jgi:hypothetical protein
MNKSHDDNNGGGQREKVKRVWQVSSWHCIFHPQLWVENRDMCSPKESNELFSGQDIGKARILESEESHGKTLLEVSGRWENEEEETSARKVEKEWEGSVRIPGSFIVKRKGVDVFLERSSGKISLACGNLWCEGHPSYPVYANGTAKDL